MSMPSVCHSSPTDVLNTNDTLIDSLNPLTATQDVVNEILEAYREVIDDTAGQVIALGKLTGFPPIIQIATILGNTVIVSI